MVEALRWLLGILSATVGVGWLALAILGGSFRSSFGASPVGLLTQATPLVVFAMVLASVLAPGYSHPSPRHCCGRRSKLHWLGLSLARVSLRRDDWPRVLWSLVAVLQQVALSRVAMLSESPDQRCISHHIHHAPTLNAFSPGTTRLPAPQCTAASAE
jgi:hypothetical protein